MVRLSIERQNLLRRLRTAEIAAQVKRLIALESLCLHASRTLPEQPDARRQTAALKAIADQRDARPCSYLVEHGRRQQWGGPVRASAPTGCSFKIARVGETRLRRRKSRSRRLCPPPTTHRP